MPPRNRFLIFDSEASLLETRRHDRYHHHHPILKITQPPPPLEKSESKNSTSTLQCLLYTLPGLHTSNYSTSPKFRDTNSPATGCLLYTAAFYRALSGTYKNRPGTLPVGPPTLYPLLVYVNVTFILRNPLPPVFAGHVCTVLWLLCALFFVFR